MKDGPTLVMNISPRTGDWEKTMTLIVKHVYDLIFMKRVTALFYECPAYMATAAAANARQDIVKLTLLAGAIHGACITGTCSDVFPIPIRDWKGQTPKDLMNRRVLKTMQARNWPCEDIKTTHELDAIGIGLYVKGVQ